MRINPIDGGYSPAVAGLFEKNTAQSTNFTNMLINEMGKDDNQVGAVKDVAAEAARYPTSEDFLALLFNPMPLDSAEPAGDDFAEALEEYLTQSYVEKAKDQDSEQESEEEYLTENSQQASDE